jgi:transcriptional regulator with XRE-family HTH domain
MRSETFGSFIRKIRVEHNMPLRKLAASLDIDQSTLSKIETNQRQPTIDMIPVLASVFKINSKELKVKFLSEKILEEIMDDECGIDALKAAVQQIHFKNSKNK